MRAFSQYHPAVLLAYFSAVLLIVVFVTNPVIQGCALLGGVLFAVQASGGAVKAKTAGSYFVLFWAVALTNPLFSHSGATVLFRVGRTPITLESFWYGVSAATAIVAVLLWCNGYRRVLTDDKFLYLFGRAAPKLALVLSMAFRFIPRFTRQMKRVSEAQKTMGLYGENGHKAALNSQLRVFRAILAWSFENTMDTADSMKARGYGRPVDGRFSTFRFTARDGVLLAVCVLLTAVTLAGVAMGVTAFAYYPTVARLNLTPAAVGVYAAFAGLTLLPFMIE